MEEDHLIEPLWLFLFKCLDTSPGRVICQRIKWRVSTTVHGDNVRTAARMCTRASSREIARGTARSPTCRPLAMSMHAPAIPPCMLPWVMLPNARQYTALFIQENKQINVAECWNRTIETVAVAVTSRQS